MTDIILITIYSALIISIHYLSNPKIAYKGNIIAFFSVSLALIYNLIYLSATKLLISVFIISLGALIGIILTNKTQTKSLPQNVALLNGLGGLSSTLISITELYLNNFSSPFILSIIYLGSITFTGSLASIIRLNNTPLLISTQKLKYLSLLLLLLTIANLIIFPHSSLIRLFTFIALSSLTGFIFVLSIGKADMPIIISLLNSLSGFITSFIGINTNSILLLITGTLIGASGAILTIIMTKSMNRSLFSVLFRHQTYSISSNSTQQNINKASPKDVAFLLENANKVIIVPGYGMAVSNAEDELKTLSDILTTKYNTDTKFAIHPIAGRMPGHLNVLLAKADIPLSQIYELKDINQEFKTADVAFIIGANDIINPRAQTDSTSPIYQMPILNAKDAKKIIFAKRSLSPGYSGIDNPLFYQENTLFLLGDAKEMTKKVIKELE